MGRYERNEVKPSIEVATKIMDALEISLDYLVGHSDLILEHNVLDRVLNIQKLSDKDREHLFAMMDVFISDAKTRRAYL
ncbi:helix-turn-helix domain-containing protein [Croceivirga radicis]|uniref:helix-turn-helix domain-containing protein n=1 Tax=Croceivirga radicis TaxID=1929488 RepID=UPI0009D9B8D5